jgi:hypothetical protein
MGMLTATVAGIRNYFVVYARRNAASFATLPAVAMMRATASDRVPKHRHCR